MKMCSYLISFISSRSLSRFIELSTTLLDLELLPAVPLKGDKVRVSKFATDFPETSTESSGGSEYIVKTIKFSSPSCVAF